MYSVYDYTGQILRESDGLLIAPNDLDPDFKEYEAWLLAGHTPTIIEGEPVFTAMIRLCNTIDKKADKVYLSVVSSPGKLQEYIQSEAEALQYNKDGTVGTNVKIWADVNGWTMQQSVDSILTAAGKFREAMATIRAIRLTGKSVIKSYQGNKVSDIEAICADYVSQLNDIQIMLQSVI